MTLYYSLVSRHNNPVQLFVLMPALGNGITHDWTRTLLTTIPSGLPPPRVRDGTLHAPHRAPPLHDSPEDVHLHVRFPLRK